MPTVSVLIGDESASIAAIRRWALAEGRPVLCVDGRSEAEARQALLDRALRLPDVESRAYVALAVALARPVEEVQRCLAYSRERELFARALETLPERASAAFALLARRAPRDGWCLAENLTAILELFEPSWPCLLLPGARTSAACLRQVEGWIGRAPALPACLVVNESLWSKLESELDGTRLLGVLREGVTEVRAPPGIARSSATFVGRPTTTPESIATGAPLTPEGAAHVLERTDAPPGELERARSIIEAFLFQLLELRATTVGLFELNVKLDFNHGAQRAEVDLLCASLRIALEVDGYHHFVDRVAVRRDRRKDLLLQRHNYVVMRVLAEDVVPQMATVLGDIEDVLAWRREQLISEP